MAHQRSPEAIQRSWPCRGKRSLSTHSSFTVTSHRILIAPDWSIGPNDRWPNRTATREFEQFASRFHNHGTVAKNLSKFSAEPQRSLLLTLRTTFWILIKRIRPSSTRSSYSLWLTCLKRESSVSIRYLFRYGFSIWKHLVMNDQSALAKYLSRFNKRIRSWIKARSESMHWIM